VEKQLLSQFKQHNNYVAFIPVICIDLLQPL